MSMSSRRRRPVLSARPKLGQLPFHRRVVQQARVNDVQAARYLDDEVTERSVWRGLGAAVLEVRDPRNPLPPTEAQCARALKVCSLGIGCLPAGEAPLHGAVGMPDCHGPSAARLPLHGASFCSACEVSMGWFALGPPRLQTTRCHVVHHHVKRVLFTSCAGDVNDTHLCALTRCAHPPLAHATQRRSIRGPVGCPLLQTVGT